MVGWWALSRLLERMRREGLHAQVMDLFERPTVAALAEVIEEVEEMIL